MSSTAPATTSTAAEPAMTARQRILEAGLDLFYREGLHGVGVDRIVAQSGVAKMTLYGHFKGKDGLIEAVVNEHHRRWCQWFCGRVKAAPGTARQRLVGAFDVLAELMGRPEFRGCALVNAAVELPDPGHPVRRAIVRNKAEVAEFLTDLAREAGLPEPAAAGEQLLVLIHGAIITAQVAGLSGAAASAKRAAEAVVQNAAR